MNLPALGLPGTAIMRLVVVGLLAAGGCSLLDDDANSDRLTVFVASSLTDVIGDLATAWESAGGSGLVDKRDGI